MNRIPISVLEDQNPNRKVKGKPLNKHPYSHTRYLHTWQELHHFKKLDSK